MLFMGDISPQSRKRDQTKTDMLLHVQTLTSVLVSIFPGGILLHTDNPGQRLLNSYVDYEND